MTMQPLTRRFPLGEPEFEFAGFKWPRFVATLPERPLSPKEMEHRKNPCAGPYSHAPKPESAGKGTFFYLDHDGPIGLRWAYADEIPSDWGYSRDLWHRGWYCDESQDQTIRGLVFKLPKERGFLSGWTMGEGMASGVEGCVFEDVLDAQVGADETARVTAEREREYQELESAKYEKEEDLENAISTLREALRKRSFLLEGVHSLASLKVPEQFVENLREQRELLTLECQGYIADIRRLREELEELEDQA